MPQGSIFARILTNPNSGFGEQSLPIQALIDTGTEANFLDTEVAKQAGIPVVPLESNIPVCALNGRG